MFQSAAGKLNARCSAFVLNDFDVMHSDTFAHKTGSESLAYCFFCSISCGITLGLSVKIFGGIAIIYLGYGKALIDKSLITVFYLLYES